MVNNKDVSLVNFSTSNCACFAEETKLDLLCDEKENHFSYAMLSCSDKIKVVPVCLVTGANSSGKTMLLNLISTMCKTVASNQIKPIEPFRYDETYRTKPSKLAVVLSVGGLCYEYGFELMCQDGQFQIQQEWLEPDLETLTPIHNSSYILSFRRVRKEGNFETTCNSSMIQEFREKVEYEVKYTSNESLLLCSLVDFDNVKKMLNWFRATTYISQDDVDVDDITVREELVNLAKKLDPTIDDIIIKQGIYVERKTIHTSLASESKGLKRLLGTIAPAVYRALDTGGLLLVDEIENSFNPFVIAHFMKLFQVHFRNPNKAQLIFTTHNSFIMQKRFLRSEQVCFTEKDENSTCKLCSVYDFYAKTQDAYHNRTWGEDYLQGVFVNQSDMS